MLCSLNIFAFKYVIKNLECEKIDSDLIDILCRSDLH